MLALCFTTIIKTFQLYLTVDKPKILSLNKVYSVHTPEVPLTQLERVICCFWLVLDLVLVFVGLGLIPDLLALSISPHSKDHALHRRTNLDHLTLTE